MEEQFITTGETPRVLLEVRGDLRLKGSDELEVRAQTDSPGDLNLEGQGDEVRIRCRGDCVVMVPYTALVTVDSVHGNAQIKALEGELSIDSVHGDLDLRNVGLTRLRQVRGNLAAKHIAGEFEVQGVDGNSTVQDVLGSFKVSGAVKGNLSLDDVEGDASAKVHGNATLRLDPLPARTYDFSASGNIVCRLPADVSARLQISKAARISVSLPSADVPESLSPPVDLSIGDGDATLKLSANGNIQLSEWAPNWEMSEDFDADFGETFGEDFEGMADSIAEQVTQQVEAQMEMLSRHLEQQMAHLATSMGAAGFSPEEAERVSQRAREASERATARAQQKMQLSQERIQRKIEAAQRRAEHKARMAERRHARHERRHYEWSSPKPGPTVDAVTEDERLVILKMLEEKKISLIEAEQLLAALEGKES